MGTFGTGILDNDTSGELYNKFIEHLESGLEIPKIVDRINSQFIEYNKGDSKTDFTFALGLALWENCSLDEKTLLEIKELIESGIDIPNANTIIIDRADRFGLADLYQLRGRVGRAGGQAYAILLLTSDLINGDARKRINAIQQYTALGSGFKIAMRDLEIRGAGNLLGTKQSGHIAAVGFDLYCQLLRQSIDRLRDGKITQRVDVTFRADFICLSEAEYAQASAQETRNDSIGNLPAYLPANYMPEARLRISAYKELAELVTQKELRSLKSRWIDRFGKPPQCVTHLLAATAVKLAAASAGISTVEIREQRLMLTRNGEYIFLSGKRFPRLTSITPEDKLTETLEMLESI